MRRQRIARLVAFHLSFVVGISTIGISLATEIASPLDLVSSDVAFCVQIPNLDETWTLIEKGPLMERLRATPAWQRLLESKGFQHSQMVDDHVDRLTGKKLSVQLRALLGRSLVLAAYIPADGPPRGILIGEANDRAAVEMALNTRNKLEPTEVVFFKVRNGVRYQQRKKPVNDAQAIFVATFDRWYCVSDQESLVLDVIDRFGVATGSASTSVAGESLSSSKTFTQNAQRLKPGAAAYLYINARPWDRGLEEAARNERGPVSAAVIWKHVNFVSACLQLDHGVVCEAIAEFDTAHLPASWSQFVATAATESNWLRRIPPESLLAIGGHLELAPFVRFFVSHVPLRDQAELAKNRRVVQSLLHGQELLESVLPALGRNFCGSIVARQDESTKRMVLDGAIGFQLNSTGDAKLLLDVGRGLDTGLSLLAAFFSAEGPGVVAVERDKTDSMDLSWLSSSAPVPMAFGIKGENLVIAGSLERLRRSLDSLSHGASHPRLNEHSRRFFPGANQLVWFDTAVTRDLLREHGAELAEFFAHGSAEESSRLANHFEHIRPMLGLVDSIFIAGQFESDHIRIAIGGAWDSKK